MKFLILSLVCLSFANANSLHKRLLDRITSRGHADALSANADEAALLDALARALSQRGFVEDLPSTLRCGDLNENQIASAIAEPAANLDCVYGYIIQDWIDTFAAIKANPGARGDDMATLMTCVGDIVTPVLQGIVDNRSNKNSIPDSCGVWTGRFPSSSSGNVYEGCDDALLANGYDDEKIFSYVTEENACRLHMDMTALEGVLAAAGEVGSISGNPPHELCVFNVLKNDARWFRANRNVQGCDYRMESRRGLGNSANGLVAIDSVVDLLRKLIGRN